MWWWRKSWADAVVGRCRLELFDIEPLGNFRLGLVDCAVALIWVVVYSGVGDMRVRVPVPQRFQAGSGREVSAQVGLAMGLLPAC